MPKPLSAKPEERQGDIEIKAKKNYRFDGYYKPRPRMAEVAGIKFGTSAKMLHVDLKKRILVIYPLITWADHLDFLAPKYSKISAIRFPIEESLCDFLIKQGSFGEHDLAVLMDSTLLPGFTKDPDYGLGISREFKDVIDAIQEHCNCNELRFSEENSTSEDQRSNAFILSIDDYDAARVHIKRITSLGQKAAAEVKDGTVYNLIAERLGKPAKTISVGRSPVRKLITAAAQGKPPLTEGDQVTVINILRSHSKQIAEGKPEALAKLQNELELVTLEVLIQRYEELLGKTTVESDWQRFFNENKFILTMAFGYPIVQIIEQASVGGGQLVGGGGKFSDFVSKNSQTNNAALFEIKTPKTPLLNKHPFRGKVFSATSEFSGAIIQILDQKYQFGMSLPQLKFNDRGLDLEAYTIHCCLIIGTTPNGLEEQKSFELFRRNSRSVEIITFDELLVKLKQLYAFLSTNADQT